MTPVIAVAINNSVKVNPRSAYRKQPDIGIMALAQ
jgi:hypothetical protein